MVGGPAQAWWIRKWHCQPPVWWVFYSRWPWAWYLAQLITAPTLRSSWRNDTNVSTGPTQAVLVRMGSYVSFESHATCCGHLKSLKWSCSCCPALSHVWLFATPWTITHQDPLSVEFSRQEYWSGFSFPLPRDLPDPRDQIRVSCASALASGFFTSATWETH